MRKKNRNNIVASLNTKVRFEHFLICTAELKTADNEVGQISFVPSTKRTFYMLQQERVAISISPLFSHELLMIKLMFAYKTQQDF